MAEPLVREEVTEISAALKRLESRKQRRSRLLITVVVIAIALIAGFLLFFILPGPVVDNCSNSVLDPGEEGVDCGGVCLRACPIVKPVLSDFEVKPVSIVDVALGADGKIYLVDQIRNKLVVYDSQFKYLASLGEEKVETEYGFLFVSGGPEEGKFDFPMSAAIDNQNRIVVLDRYNKRLQLFSQDFELLRVIPLSEGFVGDYYTGARFIKFDKAGKRFFVSDQHFHKVAVFDSELNYLQALGTGKGSGNLEFNNPEGIAFDSKGNVFVADKGNSRVQVFDSELNFKQSLSTGLLKPKGIAIGPGDKLYVVDDGSATVKLFDSQLQPIGEIGEGLGYGEDELYQPRGIAVASDGKIYVADSGNVRLKVYNKSNQLLQLLNGFTEAAGVSFSPLFAAEAPNGKIVASDWLNCKLFVFDEDYGFETTIGDRRGFGQYEFNDPRGIAFDSLGRLFVADKGNNRVQVYDSDFKYIATIEGSGENSLNSPRNIAFDKGSNIYIGDAKKHAIMVFNQNFQFVKAIGTEGEGKLSYPLGVFIDSDGKIYANDSKLNAIKVYDSEGSFLETILAPADSQKFSSSIVVDSKGNLLVPDHFLGRVNVFNPETRQWTSFGSFGEGEGQFRFLKGLDITTDGKILVGDAGNHRIDIFSKDYKFIESISIG